MNKYFKWFLWAVAGFFIIGGVAKPSLAPIILGLMISVVSMYNEIGGIFKSNASSSASKQLLNLKELYDKEIITKEEYDEKSEKLKSKL